ncbi:hypothetical protein [Joostella sp. CR20]|uniref:hypothetical protein n=1 Tax=Joostella sp. CR20 TaxID=2804312 RepID=UPI00313B6B16
MLNKTSNASTITNQEGFFEIDAKANDQLVFTALQFEIKFVEISEEIIAEKYLEVTLVEKVNVLAPVTITPYSLSGNLTNDIKNNPINDVVNAVSLGLPNATVKKKTHSERMLYTASNGPIDLIVNTINGKIKRIKKLIKLQKEEVKLMDTKELFEVDFYVKDLKIPEDYIDRFMYFCAVDPKFKEIENNDPLQILAFLELKSADFKTVNNIE